MGLLVVEMWTIQCFPGPCVGFGPQVSWKQEIIHISMSLAVTSKIEISALAYL